MIGKLILENEIKKLKIFIDEYVDFPFCKLP